MKEGTYLSEGHHRLRMVELAVSDIPGFTFSDVELVRKGMTYTVDTLRQMLDDSLDPDEVFLLLGADAYASFERWKEPAEILRLCTLAVSSRPGGPEPGFEKLDALLPRGSHRAVSVPVQQLEISSSDIRERAQSRLSLRECVPAAVEAYIHENQLYSDTSALDAKRG